MIGTICMLEHKTYSTELLKPAHDLITEVTKDWKHWQYPPYERLKETYETRDNFTPETRHFAYKDGKLVGFLASAREREADGKVIGSIQRPFILNDDPKVEQFLMEKALKTLKEKKVDVVQTAYQEGWGDPEFLKRHGYKKGDVALKLTEIPFKTYDTSNFANKYNVREADPVEDKGAIIEAFKTEMTQTEEEIGQIIDQWKEAPNILCNAIVREGDEIISHSMVIQNPNNKNGFMTAISIYREGRDELRKETFLYIMKKVQKSDREVLNFNLSPDFFNSLPFYEEMGLEMRDFYRYELNLED